MIVRPRIKIPKKFRKNSELAQELEQAIRVRQYEDIVLHRKNMESLFAELDRKLLRGMIGFYYP